MINAWRPSNPPRISSPTISSDKVLHLHSSLAVRTSLDRYILLHFFQLDTPLSAGTAHADPRVSISHLLPVVDRDLHAVVASATEDTLQPILLNLGRTEIPRCSKVLDCIRMSSIILVLQKIDVAHLPAKSGYSAMYLSISHASTLSKWSSAALSAMNLRSPCSSLFNGFGVKLSPYMKGIKSVSRSTETPYKSAMYSLTRLAAAACTHGTR